MCDVQELRRRDCKEHKGKGDTGRLGGHRETQETARRLQGDAGDHREIQETTGRYRRPQGDTGDCRETQETARKTQGDTGDSVARLSNK